MINPRSPSPGQLARVVSYAALLLSLSGCSGFGRWIGPRWHTDFDSAEAALRESNKDLLIRFVDPKPGRSDPLGAAFSGKAVSKRLGDYVCCRLYQSYEPDRRYVGQYGVLRAPAVIVVHPDQTYHAREGRMSADDLLSFLDESAEPGLTAKLNPHIRRDPVFHWQNGFPAVNDAVAATGRPGFVILYRRFTSDLRVLESMIETHEVYARVADMVHGKVASWNRWARTLQTPYGEVKLPAILFVHADGRHEVLEMPTSSEDIARFADRSTLLTDNSAAQAALQSEPVKQVEPTASVLSRDVR